MGYEINSNSTICTTFVQTNNEETTKLHIFSQKTIFHKRPCDPIVILVQYSKAPGVKDW